MSVRILIVDDEESVRSVLTRVLKREGYAVDASVDGPSALARLNTTIYDVLLTDLMMPGMSGLDLVSAARQGCPGLCCIVMTGLTDTERPADVSWLEKPIDIDHLLSLLPPGEEAEA